MVADSSLTGILVPRSTDNPPPPVRYLNPFCQLIIVQALHHHIWEFRSQYAVYRSMGISVSIWQGEAHDRELSVGFAGHQVVSVPGYRSGLSQAYHRVVASGSTGFLARCLLR